MGSHPAPARRSRASATLQVRRAEGVRSRRREPSHRPELCDHYRLHRSRPISNVVVGRFRRGTAASKVAPGRGGARNPLRYRAHLSERRLHSLEGIRVSSIARTGDAFAVDPTSRGRGSPRRRIRSSRPGFERAEVRGETGSDPRGDTPRARQRDRVGRPELCFEPAGRERKGPREGDRSSPGSREPGSRHRTCPTASRRGRNARPGRRAAHPSRRGRSREVGAASGGSRFGHESTPSSPPELTTARSLPPCSRRQLFGFAGQEAH